MRIRENGLSLLDRIYVPHFIVDDPRGAPDDRLGGVMLVWGRWFLDWDPQRRLRLRAGRDTGTSADDRTVADVLNDRSRRRRTAAR